MELMKYEEIHKLINKICDQIEYTGKEYLYIYGIPHGGLIPAAMIAYRLKIYLVDNIRRPQDTLIVDDGVFTGKTIKYYQSIYGLHYDIAVLVARNNTDLITYLGKKVDDYIIFPWESLKK